jgi:hypothetical protein
MCKPVSGDYIAEIERFPDEFFDCILVDGRHRVECVKAAARKTKRVLILDNALRGRYAAAIQFMEHQQIWESEMVKWDVPEKGRIGESWHSMVWQRK